MKKRRRRLSAVFFFYCLCLLLGLSSPVHIPSALDISSSSPSTSTTTEENQPSDTMDESPYQGTFDFIFSDVDGTLVHYSDDDDENNTKINSKNKNKNIEGSIIKLPPSSTGKCGIISSKTLELCQKLRRDHNIKLILVSGMRTSTFLKRLPYLPKADAYACEAGGRIFYPTHSENCDDSSLIRPVKFDGSLEEDLEPFGLQEDKHWRSVMSKDMAAGVDGYCGDSADAFIADQKSTFRPPIPLKRRKGVLWDFAKSLVARGFIIDCNNYACCFRVNKQQQLVGSVNFAEFEALNSIDTASLALGSSVNLGCIDFYPLESGKKNCCTYLANKFYRKGTNSMMHQLSKNEILSQRAVCLCDDDNDLEMAMACKKAFLPTISSPSIAQAAFDHPKKFTVVERKEQCIISTIATDVALKKILEELTRSSNHFAP